MQITQKDLVTFKADIIIDNHINYGEDYTLFTLEDEDGKAVCQVLVSPRSDEEEVWEVFSAKFPQAADFEEIDTSHRDNCPLFIVEID
tara:strand:+ start:853 stop:1116 length:264 start_codon:yes stop_codon:yes gene_type:complete